MLRHVLCWLLLLSLAVALAPLASAESPADKKSNIGDLRWKDESGTTPALPTAPSNVPVFEFLLATAGTALVLFILCAPSRRR